MSKYYFTYNITAINSTGAAKVVEYGNVNDWWLSHPDVINTQAFIQVSGKGSASGTFKILVPGGDILVDFVYKPGEKPSFTYIKRTPDLYIVQISNGPYVEGMTAHCTFYVLDLRK